MNPRWTSGVVLVCFFLSGMAGLVYQVAWSRYLSLFLGHSSYAVVAVLVAFMGGLAIGNAWLGAVADRLKRPLAFYAWLEIAIGVYALIFPQYNEFVHASYIRAAQQFEPGSSATVLLKFGFSLLTILLPTAMMGATFPALTKFVTHSLGELREKVALLYFVNSAGAVGGCLVAEFIWIPEIGLEATVFASAALNLAVGAVALWLSARFASVVIVPTSAQPSVPQETFTRTELRLAVWGIGLSGFVAMLYEVAWTRLLALTLGSSSHAFTIMLITFISGIAVGAWVVSRWTSLKDSLRAFAWAELALAGTVFISMFFYERLPFWFIGLTRQIAIGPDTYYLYQLIQGGLCFAVMFVPALCLGTTLPLVSRIATAEVANSGRQVGRVFAVNTVGTVLGAAITGLWLMPNLGLARTFGLGIGLNAFIGASILAHRKGIPLGKVVGGTVAGAAALVLLAGALFHDDWSRVFSTGLYRARYASAHASLWQNSRLAFYRDGASGTVSVLQSGEGTNSHFALKVNGKTDASTGGDVSTQLLLAHVPLILRPQAQRALVVGLGSGMTAAAALRHTNVVSVDTVELSPDVVKAAAYFAPWNDNVLENPRMRVTVEDAKTFLQAGSTKYDVIISEPSNPWMAGVAGVFTKEYYADCAKRLSEDGLMVQWVQIYETDDEAVKTVLATFSSIFPFMGIWQAHAGDLLLVGSLREPQVSLTAAEAVFNQAAVKSSLARLGMTSLSVLLAHEKISPDDGPFLVPDNTPIHSDNFPVLEQMAQRAFFTGAASTLVAAHDEIQHPRPTTLLGRWLADQPLKAEDYAAFADFFLTHKYPGERVFRTLVMEWEEKMPGTTMQLELSTLTGDMRPRAEVEVLQWRNRREEFFALADKDPYPLRLYTLSQMRVYRMHRSAFHVPDSTELQACLQKLIQTDAENERLYALHRAELAWDRGDDDECLKFGVDALDPRGARGSRVQFDFDPTAPYQVVARILRIHLDRKDWAAAQKVAIEADASGWFRPSEAKPAWLNILQRRVEALPISGNSLPEKLPTL